MKWFHKCSKEWLKERQNYLTATDVKELLPITKTGRPRKVSEENYFKVLARKNVCITDDDCISIGAAARGHVLEPWAIRVYNAFTPSLKLYHWDDLIVTKPNASIYTLAFSPDAMDIEMPPDTDGAVAECMTPTAIGEVKCYSAEKHLICGYTKKEDLEERWQIATAMAVLPSIERAKLLFYNPSMVNQLYIVEYERDDLLAEIDIINDIETDWLDFIDSLHVVDSHFCIKGSKNDEQLIVDSIIEGEKLIPDAMKSVVM